MSDSYLYDLFEEDKVTDLNRFTPGKINLQKYKFIITVKALNQNVKRVNMLKKLAQGYAATINRSHAENGYILLCSIVDGNLVEHKRVKCREPRHVIFDHSGDLLVSASHEIFRLDTNLTIKNIYKSKYFNLLHTLDLSADKSSILACSTGLDMVLELNSINAEVKRAWSAWENGFNPDLNGIWLTYDMSEYMQIKSSGRPATYVNIEEYSDYRIINNRSAHPNFAYYDINSRDSIAVNIAYSGELYRINLNDNTMELILKTSPMSHGLIRHGDGWGLTETIKGRWLFMSSNNEIKGTIDASLLGNKHKESGDAEWLQMVRPLDNGKYLFIDANRGMFVIDITKRTIQFINHNDNYCLQDILCIDSH